MKTAERNKADRIANDVADLLKDQGFKKKRRTWTLQNEEVIHVFNVQGSQWSRDDFYVNVGVYLKGLGDLQFPPESKCHVRRRVPSSDLRIMLDFSLDWFEERRSIADLRARLQDNDSGEFVTAAARKYLGS